MPSDVLGRNTPFYFNTSKILARVATDCFKYDVYIKKGNMARKSPAKKSNPFAQTKYFFFIYLFCMYRGSILKLPLGARNIQISNRYMFGTKAAGYCGKINLAISAGTKCANGRLAGKQILSSILIFVTGGSGLVLSQCFSALVNTNDQFSEDKTFWCTRYRLTIILREFTIFNHFLAGNL